MVSANLGIISLRINFRQLFAFYKLKAFLGEKQEEVNSFVDFVLENEVLSTFRRAWLYFNQEIIRVLCSSEF
jgi:hypothetical protein